MLLVAILAMIPSNGMWIVIKCLFMYHCISAHICVYVYAVVVAIEFSKIIFSVSLKLAVLKNENTLHLHSYQICQIQQ